MGDDCSQMSGPLPALWLSTNAVQFIRRPWRSLFLSFFAFLCSARRTFPFLLHSSDFCHSFSVPRFCSSATPLACGTAGLSDSNVFIWLCEVCIRIYIAFTKVYVVVIRFDNAFMENYMVLSRGITFVHSFTKFSYGHPQGIATLFIV